MNAENVMSLIFGTILEANERRKPEGPPHEEARRAFCKIMNHGGNFEGSKIRIYEACKKWQNEPKRLKKFLKDEYGTGGYVSDDWSVDWSAAGFRARNIASGRQGEPIEYHWSWNWAAKRFLEEYLHGDALDPGSRKTKGEMINGTD